MITLLIDHDIEGQAIQIWRMMQAEGWPELLPAQIVRFRDVNLPENSNDRNVWRYSQQNQMILLTANRSMHEENSLAQTLRSENTSISLPVLTIGNADRIRYDQDYRSRCAAAIVEVILDLDNYRGVGRVFIPLRV